MNVKADDLTQVITEAFNFDVVKLPLYAPDNQPTGIYGLFRDDLTGKDALVGSGSITNRYVPHTNDDVVALVEAASNVFEGEVDVNCYFQHGHYVASSQPKIIGLAFTVIPTMFGLRFSLVLAMMVELLKQPLVLIGICVRIWR